MPTNKPVADALMHLQRSITAVLPAVGGRPEPGSPPPETRAMIENLVEELEGVAALCREYVGP